MEDEENCSESESETTVVEKPTEPDSAKLQNMGPDLNLENPSNKHAKVVGAKTSNDSEKQPSSINNEGKVQNPTTEGVSGKFSPKSRQIAAEETAEIEKQQQNNASWEDLEGEVEEANEPEPVIKFKKHVPIPKSAKGQLISKCFFDVFKLTKNQRIFCTGKSFSEALILASTNPQYDKRLFIELQVQ